MQKQDGRFAATRAGLRRGLDATTLRFLTTGLGAAGLFFGLCFALVRAGMTPFAGTLLAYGVAFVAAYSTQQAWTFRGQRRHAEALPRYLAVQIGCALLSGLLARVLAGLGGFPPLPMAAVTTVASSAISYGLSRYWVFASRTAGQRMSL